uniref:Glycine--tRNA ligase beta subunit n=1 Tax=Lygus hesperus TaxID=30085 RepID=A0A0A9Z969_LYGHE
MDEYVGKIMSTAQRLREIKFDIPDEWVATLLLTGLPDSYQPMIMALENSSTTLTADSVKVRLLQDLCLTNRQPNNESAFMSKAKFKKKPSQVKCNSCHNIGHYCTKPSQYFFQFFVYNYFPLRLTTQITLYIIQFRRALNFLKFHYSNLFFDFILTEIRGFKKDRN